LVINSYYSPLLQGFYFLLGFLTLEDGTHKLFRTVGKKSPLLSA